jgi:pyrimidine operon attenuation protein/uracil phosphoribosyltransferase
MPQVMNGEDIRRAVHRISHEILETYRGAEGLVLVGIHTRGVHLAHWLAETLERFGGSPVPVGELDITSHRDDRDLRRPRQPKESHVPLPIRGRHVILVDDVLYTGRTVRAALDALAELGRADSTELAVLVDRGHRELPIRADYVGKNIPTSRDEMVRVRFEVSDGENGVWLQRSEAA